MQISYPEYCVIYFYGDKINEKTLYDYIKLYLSQ